MYAAGLDYERRELAVRDCAEPSLTAEDQVVFRVQEVGICGTDRELACFRFGWPPLGESFLTLGHEALGQVVETGRAVTGVRRGDWVVPMVRRPCSPVCESCARGRRDLCVSDRFTEAGIFGRHGYLCEYAADEECDLVRVPEDLADCGILIEPLSVVEKAVETALRIHEPGPRRGLVLGSGPIGMLAALLLQLRGLDVSVYSLEPAEHHRVRLLERVGVRYITRLERGAADIAIEATGSAEAAFAGFTALAPLGTYGILGSPNARGEMPFIDLLRHNQALFGSVNASPQAFASAVEDLGRFDRDIVKAMIHRARFRDFQQTIGGTPSSAVKIVHSVRD